MAAIADRIDEGDLAPRMDLGGPHDEIHHLAVAFDTMLARLGDAFDRQAAFAAEASHELRTPLTVVRGQLEVLARDPNPSAEDVRHVERLVNAEVRRMSTMVDDLLVLAAPTVELRSVAVAPLVASLLDGMRATAERDFRLGPVADVIVQADPDRLAQVLRNLLRNAVEHTQPGGVVELSAQASRDTLRLIVDDDGPGIPEAEREQVFDRFHRAPGPRRTAVGAGLGLAIVAALAHAHHGLARAEVSPLGGARLIVELPLRT
jgi:two-component system, OmpR family, sensor kinase